MIRLGMLMVCLVLAFTAKAQQTGFYILNTNVPTSITSTSANLRGSFTTSDTVIVGFQKRPLDSLFTNSDNFFGLTNTMPVFSDSINQQVNGLFSNIPYYYRIVMIRMDSMFLDTLYGASIAFTPTAQVVAAPVVTNVQSVSTTYNSVTVSANINTQNANTNWRVKLGTTFPLPSVSSWINMGSQSGVVSTTVSAPSGTLVQIQIEATNGQTVLSSPISVQIPSAPISDAVAGNASSSAQSHNSLTVQALITTNNSQTDIIVEYGTQLPTSNSTGWLAFGTNNGTATVVLPNLLSQQQYLFRFGARNQSGVVSWGGYATAMTTSEPTNLPPTITTTLSASTTTITANGTWSGSGVFPSTIKTEYSPNANFSFPLIVVAQNNYNTSQGIESIQITGLSSGAQYYVRQIITNTSGTDTSVATIITVQNIVQVTVNNATVVSQSAGQATISYVVSMGSDSPALMELEGSLDPSFSTITEFASANVTASGTQSLIASSVLLSAGSTWYMRVRGSDQNSNTVSNTVIVTIPPDLAVPTIIATTVTDTTNDGGTVVVNYNGNGNATQLTLYSGLSGTTLNDSVSQFGSSGSGSASFTLTGYLENTQVFYQVKATSIAGSVWSNVQSFVTTQDILLVPPTVATISAWGNSSGGKIKYSYAAVNDFQAWGEVTQNNWSTITPTAVEIKSAGAGIDTLTIDGPLANGTYAVQAVGYVINHAPTSGGVATFTVGSVGIPELMKRIKFEGILSLNSIEGKLIGAYAVKQFTDISFLYTETPTGVYSYTLTEDSEMLGSGKLFVK